MLSDREGIPEAADFPKREGSRYVLSTEYTGHRHLILRWIVGGKKVSTKEKRWYKDVGLGFKTPAEAIQGSYVGVYFRSLILHAPKTKPVF